MIPHEVLLLVWRERDHAQGNPAETILVHFVGRALLNRSYR
jgi:hypothetical protein